MTFAFCMPPIHDASTQHSKRICTCEIIEEFWNGTLKLILQLALEFLLKFVVCGIELVAYILHQFVGQKIWMTKM